MQRNYNDILVQGKLGIFIFTNNMFLNIAKAICYVSTTINIQSDESTVIKNELKRNLEISADESCVKAGWYALHKIVAIAINRAL